MARPRVDDSERRLRILAAERNVPRLAEILLEPGIKASLARLALEGLAEIGSHEAWDAVGEAAVACDGPIGEMIAQRLGEMMTPGAIRALGEALRNPSVFTRSSAVRALSSLENGAAIAFLLRASRDPDPTIKRIAQRILVRKVEMHPAVLADLRPETAEGVLDLLDDRWAMELLADCYPERIRVLAARRLGVLGGEDASYALASMAEVAQGEVADACWSALASCRNLQDHQLLPLLTHKDAKIRMRAVSIYGSNAHADAAALLQGLCKDVDPGVRKAALPGVVRLLEVGAIPVLQAALADADTEVRLVAIDLLAGIPDAAPELVDAVESQKGEIRRHALISLASRGICTPGLVMPFVEFLLQGASCTDLNQRDYLDGLAAAAKTLGESQAPEAQIALTSLARSVIRRLRRIAIEALMLFDPGERAEALYSLVDTYDQDVLKNVAMGLNEADDPRCAVPLIRAALECKGRAVFRAKEALSKRPEINDLDFLVKSLKERWATVRRYSAERLRLLKDRRAVPALLEASRDDDVEVQLAVLEALGPFAAEEASVTERMLEAIAYGDISVRQAACEALGEARCKAAVPHLIKALHNCFLRPRATEALKRIGDRAGYLALKRIERREKLFPKKPVELRGVKHKKAVAD